MGDVKDLPSKLKRAITEDQYKLLMAILDTLNEGRKPVITKIVEELGLSSYNYNHYLEGQTFRNALRNVLESAIDIDTLISLKYKLANDDVSTTTLAKLYLEKNKHAGGMQSFEDMVNSEDMVNAESANDIEDAKDIKEDEDASRTDEPSRSKPSKSNESKPNKPVSNVVSSINVPRVIQ